MRTAPRNVIRLVMSLYIVFNVVELDLLHRTATVSVLIHEVVIPQESRSTEKSRFSSRIRNRCYRYLFLRIWIYDDACRSAAWRASPDERLIGYEGERYRVRRFIREGSVCAPYPVRAKDIFTNRSRLENIKLDRACRHIRARERERRALREGKNGNRAVYRLWSRPNRRIWRRRGGTRDRIARRPGEFDVFAVVNRCMIRRKSYSRGGISREDRARIDHETCDYCRGGRTNDESAV